MDQTIITNVIAALIPLLALAASYGALSVRITALEKHYERLDALFEKYVTREEFRALERRIDNMDAKLDRILEQVMGGRK